jgi:hypothetical protein
MSVAGRKVGEDFPPLVIAEIGINHGGSMEKAKRMIRDAAKAGAECVKFQIHVVEDEMVPAAKKIVPGHAKQSIWDIMKKCAFSEKEDRELKRYAEHLGLFYLATPFSRASADRLHRMKVQAYKIGSGECNNYPLVEHIARFGKPVIISTGMNDVASVRRSVNILRKHKVPFALMNCTSMYPTPYEKVRLGALAHLKRSFPDAVIGQSDHSLGNYSCFGAAALGASILERHFTSDRKTLFEARTRSGRHAAARRVFSKKNVTSSILRMPASSPLRRYEKGRHSQRRTFGSNDPARERYVRWSSRRSSGSVRRVLSRPMYSSSVVISPRYEKKKSLVRYRTQGRLQPPEAHHAVGAEEQEITTTARRHGAAFS